MIMTGYEWQCVVMGEDKHGGDNGEFEWMGDDD